MQIQKLVVSEGPSQTAIAIRNMQESVIALISYFMLSLSLHLIKLTLFLKMLLHLMYTDSSSVVPLSLNGKHLLTHHMTFDFCFTTSINQLN